MTFDQANAHAKQLNGQNNIAKAEALQIAGIAKRVERDRKHHSVFMPEDRNQAFLDWIEQNTSGSADHVEKQKIIWGTVKKHIIALKLLPSDFAGNKKKIYRYFSQTKTSPDYVKKQLSLMNQYGRFCARLTGKWYEDIPMPTGIDREMIADAYLDSGKQIKKTDALTNDLLATLKDKLSEAEYNWIYVTFWFGLRPEEMEMVLEDRAGNYWRVEDGDTDILWVFQPKLRTVPRPKRWKLIPILFDEQRDALAIIVAGTAKMPSMVRLNCVKGYYLTRRAGRAGFTDLMMDRGQDLVNVSMWMGHTNIERTQKSYKDRLVVHFLNKKGSTK